MQQETGAMACCRRLGSFLLFSLGCVSLIGTSLWFNNIVSYRLGPHSNYLTGAVLFNDSVPDFGYDDTLDIFGVRYMKSVCPTFEYVGGSGEGGQGYLDSSCQALRKTSTNDQNQRAWRCDYNSGTAEWTCPMNANLDLSGCYLRFGNCTVDPRENTLNLKGAFDAGLVGSPQTEDTVCETLIAPPTDGRYTTYSMISTGKYVRDSYDFPIFLADSCEISANLGNEDYLLFINEVDPSLATATQEVAVQVVLVAVTLSFCACGVFLGRDRPAGAMIVQGTPYGGVPPPNPYGGPPPGMAYQPQPNATALASAPPDYDDDLVSSSTGYSIGSEVSEVMKRQPSVK